MDIDNAPEFAFADGLAPSGEPLAPPPPPRVRWRQRPAGRCRTEAAGAPAVPRTLITRPLASRAAAPDDTTATGRHPIEQDAAPPRSRVDDASADPGGRCDCRAEPPHPTGLGAMAAPPDTPPATRDFRQAGGARPEGASPGRRDIADDGDDPTPDGDSPIDATRDPLAEATPALGPDDAAITAATDPQRAPRDIELRLLARRAQGAALSLDFELRTAMARQVFRRDFVYVSRQLHALEGSRRVQGLDRARLDDALATLRQRADAIQAFMGQRATELQVAIAARGPAGAHIAFARPARFQATIVSPGAHRFLGLLMQADATLATLEMAWLLGLVEPATRAALVSDCRRALLGFKDLACDLRHAVGMLVQQVNAQRRAGDAAAAED